VKANVSHEAGAMAGTAGEALAIAECDDPIAWNTYVHAHPDACGYHQFQWKGVIERAFDHRCLYLTARRDGGIVGLLPMVEFRSRLFGRFAVSLPFVNYGGVLADDQSIAEQLAAAAVNVAGQRGWRHIELRHIARRFPGWPARSHKVAMSRPLPADPESLWASIDRKVRNLVRKAEKAGCTAENGGPELVADFYRVFARNMRDLGTPVYTRRLFDLVLDTFRDDARVHVVRVGHEPVAAGVTIAYRDRVEVPWASSLRSHSDKSPNMLLYWTMLQHAIARDAAVFDFGRSTPGEGTFLFKRQWGAEPRPLVWEYLGERASLPDRSPSNPRFRLAVALWQRMPVPIATWCGPHIVRNIP
jgi:serine/alanine adding enzyme